MVAEPKAKGIVLSNDPLLTLTADLVNHELILMFRSEAGYLPTSVTIKEQKLLDLIRFAQLAVGPNSDEHRAIQSFCWRCNMIFERTREQCPVCLMEAHCEQCSQSLHPSEAR